MSDFSAKTFNSYGGVCAKKSWEVIFSIVTVTAIMISYIDFQKDKVHVPISKEYTGIEGFIMTILRIYALVKSYSQIKSLLRLNSRYIIGLCASLVLYSSLAYCFTVMKFLDSHYTDLSDALFIFFSSLNLSRAIYLTQHALEASTHLEAKQNIANGLTQIGPSLSLDVFTEVLSIGAISLCRVPRVEQVCGFIVISSLVNYIALLSIYPACLSLSLDLVTRTSSLRPAWQAYRPTGRSQSIHITTNPVVQAVKKVMSPSLLLVHLCARSQLFNKTGLEVSLPAAEVMPTTVLKFADYAGTTLIYVILFIVFAWQIMSKDSKPVTNTKDMTCQTKESTPIVITPKKEARSFEKCVEILKTNINWRTEINDEELLSLVENDVVKPRSLEADLENCSRAVAIRRNYLARKHYPQNTSVFDDLSYLHYDFDKVYKKNIENPIGYVPVPVGVAGPLKLNMVLGKNKRTKEFSCIPMATTEGALVASTSRGCKAMNKARGGVKVMVNNVGITRGPYIELPSADRAWEVMHWIQDRDNENTIRQVFESTSNHMKLVSVFPKPVGNLLFLRFCADTGDALGMNMVSKGTEAAIKKLQAEFPDIVDYNLSGNFCTDKKNSALNWILGRGKEVNVEALLPGKAVRDILKVDSEKLARNCYQKNHIGTSLVGSIGGFNAHAANMVAAIFIACGQDPAQVVDSASCLTRMEARDEDLYVSVTMPCIEVGTVGGGTGLPAQNACLKMLGVQGASDIAGENAMELAAVIAATVMAGEISLLASQTENTLVKSHMHLNRRKEGTLIFSQPKEQKQVVKSAEGV